MRRRKDVCEVDKDYRYGLQQDFLNSLSKKYGFCCYRPDYHGLSGDANTVLFYTLEAEKHNQEVDKKPVHYSTSEARLYGGVIPEEYIYQDAFWTFANTDVNGMLSYEFANFGKLDLRALNWKEVLEEAVVKALNIDGEKTVRTKLSDVICSCVADDCIGHCNTGTYCFEVTRLANDILEAGFTLPEKKCREEK